MKPRQIVSAVGRNCFWAFAVAVMAAALAVAIVGFSQALETEGAAPGPENAASAPGIPGWDTSGFNPVSENVMTGLRGLQYTSIGSDLPPDFIAVVKRMNPKSTVDRSLMGTLNLPEHFELQLASVRTLDTASRKAVLLNIRDTVLKAYAANKDKLVRMADARANVIDTAVKSVDPSGMNQADRNRFIAQLDAAADELAPFTPISAKARGVVNTARMAVGNARIHKNFALLQRMFADDHDGALQDAIAGADRSAVLDSEQDPGAIPAVDQLKPHEASANEVALAQVPDANASSASDLEEALKNGGILLPLSKHDGNYLPEKEATILRKFDGQKAAIYGTLKVKSYQVSRFTGEHSWTSNSPIAVSASGQVASAKTKNHRYYGKIDYTHIDVYVGNDLLDSREFSSKADANRFMQSYYKYNNLPVLVTFKVSVNKNLRLSISGIRHVEDLDAAPAASLTGLAKFWAQTKNYFNLGEASMISPMKTSRGRLGLALIGGGFLAMLAALGFSWAGLSIPTIIPAVTTIILMLTGVTARISSIQLPGDAAPPAVSVPQNQNSGKKGLNLPQGVTVDPYGTIYVADTGSKAAPEQAGARTKADPYMLVATSLLATLLIVLTGFSIFSGSAMPAILCALSAAWTLAHLIQMVR